MQLAVIILSAEMRQNYRPSTNYEKFDFKNAANVLGSLTLSAPAGDRSPQHAQNLHSRKHT